MKLKKLLACLALVAVLVCLTLAVGCFKLKSDTKSVVSIEKTKTVGLTDVYTVTYSDGSTYNFEVTNGKDADEIDVEDLFNAYVAQYPNATYEDFLQSITNVSVDKDLSISNKALSSSLKVYSEFTESYSYGWMYQQTAYETAIYCGSAVIYSINDDYTYMITNYHVLYDESAKSRTKLAEKIVCYLYGSESAPVKTNQKNSNGTTIYDYGDYAISCEYVGGSISVDIAVIRTETENIKKINENIAAIEFADGYRVGEAAIAIGNSENEGISVTKGIVSVDNEYINYSIDGTTRSYRSMRIDTAIYGGNSGGGLFNESGKLIGITNAGDGDDQNINYAIPVNIVKPVVENILHYADGGVRILRLGITVSSKNAKYVYDENTGYGVIKEDVICSEVTKDSLAENLGIKAGDKLVSIVINDQEITFNRYFNLGDALYTVRQGDTVSIVYQRDGTTIKSTECTIASGNLVSVD